MGLLLAATAVYRLWTLAPYPTNPGSSSPVEISESGATRTTLRRLFQPILPRHSPRGQRQRMIKELTRVMLTRDIEHKGRVLTAGTMGTVVRRVPSGRGVRGRVRQSAPRPADGQLRTNRDAERDGRPTARARRLELGLMISSLKFLKGNTRQQLRQRRLRVFLRRVPRHRDGTVYAVSRFIERLLPRRG